MQSKCHQVTDRVLIPNQIDTHVHVHDEMISDPIIIANKFNQYFAHIGSTLANKIPSSPHFNSYLSNPVDSVFSFHTVTEENISHIINKLKNKVS